MAATTITGQQALFAVAEELGEVRSEYITSVTTADTVVVARGISLGQTTSFKYALAQVLNKGIRQVTAYDDTIQKITVASDFSSALAAGDVIQLCWWDGDKRNKAWAAINEAIRISWPFWYRETVVNASSSAITLSSSTESYALPTDCDGLIAVGIQTSSSEQISWIFPKDSDTDGRTFYRVEGSPGALTVRFYPRFNRDGAFNVVYNSQKLCTWYAAREPVMTAESSTGGTTQLPAEYFASVGAEIYRRRLIGTRPDGGDERVFPSLQQVAQAELQRLGYGKRPINALADEYAKDQPQAQQQ